MCPFSKSLCWKNRRLQIDIIYTTIHSTVLFDMWRKKRLVHMLFADISTRHLHKRLNLNSSILYKKKPYTKQVVDVYAASLLSCHSIYWQSHFLATIPTISSRLGFKYTFGVTFIDIQTEFFKSLMHKCHHSILVKLCGAIIFHSKLVAGGACGVLKHYYWEN